MIEFKKEAKEIVEHIYDSVADYTLGNADDFAYWKEVEFTENKIMNILKDDERYGKLLKTNHKILLLIDEFRTKIKELSKQEELF